VAVWKVAVAESGAAG